MSAVRGFAGPRPARPRHPGGRDAHPTRARARGGGAERDWRRQESNLPTGCLPPGDVTDTRCRRGGSRRPRPRRREGPTWSRLPGLKFRRLASRGRGQVRVEPRDRVCSSRGARRSPAVSPVFRIGVSPGPGESGRQERADSARCFSRPHAATVAAGHRARSATPRGGYPLPSRSLRGRGAEGGAGFGEVGQRTLVRDTA